MPDDNSFATQPGAAALVTMPDLDTGERGTGTVYCVSLNVDKNHDGTMDTYFAGADATAQASPDEVWVNNGYIEPGINGTLDKDMQVTLNAPVNSSFGRITCPRDLENFFRLWICGVPAMTFSNGLSATLTCNAISGSPAINVYLAETNGGIGYLTDTNVAQSLVNETLLGMAGAPTADSSGTLIFPSGFFDGSNKYLLFEGAGIGEGQFTLTIYSGNNQIAQTSVYLDLHDVKDFYERAVITNDMSGSISNWTSAIQKVQPAVSSMSNNTNLIVFVHGFNVDVSDWLLDSDTVFKRLYWAGYNGKFMTVHWPAIYLNLSLSGFQTALSENTSIFNDSEIRAYKAGSALATYLSQVRTRFPNYELNVLAHSQGNAVMGEAMEHGAPFDNYIMTQAAMPASSYDVDAPVDPSLADTNGLSPEWQPMGYRGVYTNLTGKIVSFYNPDDYVLGIWQTDQGAGKPDGYAKHELELTFPPHIPVSPYYSYDGTNGWYNIPTELESYLVTDPQESRAMISRSRTDAAGRQNTSGIINSTIDLNAQFGFFDTTAEHSAEWTRPIQTSRPYYIQILNSINP